LNTTPVPTSYDNKPLANHAMWPGGEPQSIRDLYDAEQNGSKAGAR
jgi:hypothetical protein